ncbi:MAG: TldD/PmbA family protein [Caldisericia bacterium]|nr:TldD/PmbA family protein [Caldisericia bacterium]
MTTFEHCKELAQLISSKVNAEQYEIIIYRTTEALTRFANSSIHQNVQSHEIEVHLRLIKGLQSSVTNTTDISESGIDRLVKQSQEQLENSTLSQEPIILPASGETIVLDSPKTDRSEVFKEPEYRAQVVSRICEEAKKNATQAFGSFATTRQELFVMNSKDTLAYNESTQAQLISQIMQDTNSGFAQSTASHIQMIEDDRVKRESVDLCLRGKNPRELEPGEYEVILLPEAVEDILSMVSHMGFSTVGIQEGRSFLSEKINQPMFDPKLSISDFSQHSLQSDLPFDFEGVPKQKVELIKNGVFQAFVTDSLWARKLNLPNTGHALIAPNPFGPFPLHLVVESTGEASLADIIKQTKKAILITRFWYANPIHPKMGTCTGLTRDGTFLVENGQIAYPIRNLRYTDNLVEVLNHIHTMTREKRFYNGIVVPTMYCQSMRFVSQAPRS